MLELEALLPEMWGAVELRVGLSGMLLAGVCVGGAVEPRVWPSGVCITDAWYAGVCGIGVVRPRVWLSGVCVVDVW